MMTTMMKVASIDYPSTMRQEDRDRLLSIATCYTEDEPHEMWKNGKKLTEVTDEQSLREYCEDYDIPVSWMQYVTVCGAGDCPYCGGTIEEILDELDRPLGYQCDTCGEWIDDRML